ncbi:von Willebrand factor D and EGF domain-containing protein-like isoform X1 [Haliotis rufescens]|uniref:von Willebrand factor D and EGF domain-containing protein-like isoform X1 n=1 Tax=Haliotis rufescens TaxID=6454 RepID=UPI00201EE396|nr:von Willebrand factor D and EGF domain-containing protein-like isoform X1 [Haliotis rufescens]
MAPDISAGFCWLLFLFIGLSNGSDPCKSYISFPFLEKRSINYTLPTADTPLNDLYIDASNDWFGEEGYDLVLSSPPPGDGRCGTSYPLWVRDTLPLGGMNKTVEVCMKDGPEHCSTSFTIDVKDCGTLRVYQLKKPPVFEAAFCVDLTNPTKPRTSFKVKPTVHVDVETDTHNKDHFKFTCTFGKSHDDLLYHVLWYVNGGFIYSFPPKHWSNTFVDHSALTEDILTRSGFSTPGFQVQCAVKASLGEGFPAGGSILSDEKFIGIKIPSGTVVVKEGESVMLNLTLTAPLGCGSRSYCSMAVFVVARNQPGLCDPSAFIPTQCGLTIKGSSWRTLHHLEIKGKLTSGYNAKTALIRLYLKTDNLVISHPFWSKYEIGSVAVQVVKEAVINKQSVCHAVQDPHMRTFDGRLYEFHQPGVFLLYKHDELELEVQMQVSQCYPPRNTVQCPCGIAVRAGQTIFHIDKCNRPNWSIDFVLCKDGKDLIKILKSGTQYKIYLPTGSYLDINVTPTSKFINIQIYPSYNDHGKVSGLCGTFTNKCEDDFKKRDGTFETDPKAKHACANGNALDRFDSFAFTWRADVNLFNHDDFHRLKPWTPPILLCTCVYHNRFPQKLVEKVTCSSELNKDVCIFNQRFLPPPSSFRQCASETNRRRRSPVQRQMYREKRDAEDAGTLTTWTTATATTYCNQLFNNSPPIAACRTVEGVSKIIKQHEDNCIMDITAINAVDFATHSLEAAKSECIHEVEMNSTLHTEKTPGVPSFLSTLSAMTCSHDCSGKGTCQNGACSCNDGLGGDDCSIDKSLPPVIDGISGDGYCDLASDVCNETSLHGPYFDEHGQLQCRFVPFTVHADGTQKTGTVSYSKPLVESFVEVICILPKQQRTKRSPSSQPPEAELAAGFRISIANYGDVFSDESVLVMYNSKCQYCNVTGKAVVCAFTSQSCNAKGVCVSHGDIHPEKPCYVCDASSSVRKWTLKSADGACTATTTDTSISFSLWIIGAVVVGLLLAGVGCCIYKHGKKKSSIGDKPRGSAFMINFSTSQVASK